MNIKHTIYIFVLLTSMSIKCNASIEILPAYYQRLPIQTKQDKAVVKLITNSNKKTQALMFFSYTCHVCFMLDKEFTAWSNSVKQRVEALRVPLVGNPVSDFLAKTHYIVQRIDPSSNTNIEIFNAIYLNRAELWREDIMMSFLAHKIAPLEFKKMLSSFVIDTEYKYANQLANAFKIVNTPNYVVVTRSGVFLTNLMLTRDVKTLLATLDYLTQQ